MHFVEIARDLAFLLLIFLLNVKEAIRGGLEFDNAMARESNPQHTMDAQNLRYSSVRTSFFQYLDRMLSSVTSCLANDSAQASNSK